MNRYIRCCYCGCILGETFDDEEVPSVAYCISCFKECKYDTKEIPEQLQEWER